MGNSENPTAGGFIHWLLNPRLRKAKANRANWLTNATSEALESRRLLSANFTSLQSLTPGPAGYEPYSGLVRDSSGNLYGTTLSGGMYGDGTIFELSGANNAVYTTLVSFTGNSGSYLGAQPEASLILDSSGNLYGTTSRGGTSSDGTIFELAANHITFSTLVSLTGNSGSYLGANPYASLALDSSGNLYGTTASGGTSYDGTIFELASNHITFTSLASFTGNSGSYPGDEPWAGLTFDSSGNLYGTTEYGGTSGDGTIFELAANHTSFASLVSFTGSSGSYLGSQPQGGLILDSSGNLYGTTSSTGWGSGYGTIFELAVNHTTFTSLVSFTGSSGSHLGSQPQAGLILDSSGNLYGTTSYTGSGSGYGTVFELAGNHTKFTSLISFTGNSGMYPGGVPYAGLALDSSGNLYGTTSNYGEFGSGTAFIVPAPGYSSVTTLFAFNHGAGVNHPVGNLVKDASGNLYGMSQSGGVYNNGTIFELSGTDYSAYTTLVSFNANSSNPQVGGPDGGLVMDSSGNLYGMTQFGYGSIFELAADHTTFTTLVSFTGSFGSYPGDNPLGGLVLDNSGNLYGTTESGGAFGDGTIFELAANHTTFTKLVSFTGSSGSYLGSEPGAGLTLDSSGNLYGTTEGGGTSNSGTIFELSANHTTFTSLVSFTADSGNLGYLLYAGLTLDSSGNLYGTTYEGGTSNEGTIFELAANHSTFTMLVSLTGSSGYSGANPYGNLTLDSSGNLYGTTASGGASYDGTIFELASDHRTFTSLVSFTGSSGSYLGSLPQGGLIWDSSGNLYGNTTTGGIFGSGTIFEISTPTKLAFTSAPANTVAGSFIDSPGGVQVSIETSNGAVVSGDYDTITLTLGSNPGGATLSGALSATAANGVVTFPNLSLNKIASGYTLIATDTSAPSLTSAVSAPFSIGSATATVSAGNTMTIPSSPSGHTVLVVGALTIAGTMGGWTGKLDITNNELDIIGGSLSTITNMIQQGFNGGNWQGNGITSGTAAGDSKYLTAIGVIQNNANGTPIFSASNPFDGTVPGLNDILVKYTYYGDATLSGSVNGVDYNLIDYAYGYNQQHPLTPMSGWVNGDFNYDGKIDGSDYSLIDSSFNMQNTSLADEIATTSAQVAASTNLLPGKASRTSPATTSGQALFQTQTPIAFGPQTNVTVESSLQNRDVLDRLRPTRDST
jgi:uncharacterized repeat protein (TIGR03803 family)